jgi:hypothetical protein
MYGPGTAADIRRDRLDRWPGEAGVDRHRPEQVDLDGEIGLVLPGDTAHRQA